MAEQTELLFRVAEQLPQPMFLARDGRILRCNGACLRQLAGPGEAVEPLLAEALPEQSAPDTVRTVTIVRGERQWQATVTPVGEDLLFLMQPAADPADDLPDAAAVMRGILPAADDLQKAGSELFPLLEEQENELMQRCTARIARGYFRIMRTALHLADFERMRTGIEPCRARVDLYEPLRDMLTKAEDALQDKGILLDWEVPQGCCHGAVDLDEVLRAVMGLIANAALHAGPSRKISLRLDPSIHRLTFTVHNDLPMNETAMGHAFGMYSRSWLPDDPECGMGIGLPVAQMAARRHGGTVMLESREGFGTSAVMVIRLDLDANDCNTLKTELFGGCDPVLTELSAVLGPETYDSRNVDI